VAGLESGPRMGVVFGVGGARQQRRCGPSSWRERSPISPFGARSSAAVSVGSQAMPS
jgi:hypothetical protein